MMRHILCEREPDTFLMVHVFLLRWVNLLQCKLAEKKNLNSETEKAPILLLLLLSSLFVIP